MTTDELIDNLPMGVKTTITQYAGALGRSPEWVVERILFDYFARALARQRAWGKAPELLYEFAEPGLEGAHFGEWLTAVYLDGENRARENTLLRQHRDGNVLNDEDLDWLYGRRTGPR